MPSGLWGLGRRSEVAGVLLHYQLEGGGDLRVQLDADLVGTQSADFRDLYRPLVQGSARLHK